MQPHFGQKVLHTGVVLADAKAVMVMIHGRGATAESILSLSAEFDTKDWAFLAPQAANHTWYPYPFIAPVAHNEPYLSSALFTLDALINDLNAKGISSERIALLGFSQGACLTLEFAARHGRKWAGVVALSGGLIGQEIDAANYSGDFAGSKIFLGCSDRDSHIPLARVQESTRILREMGADVTERIYPNAPHAVNADEIAWIRELVN